MEKHEFPPPPASAGPIKRQECIKGDPIEPPDELNQAFLGNYDDHDDYHGMSPIEDGVGNLQLSPSTPDRCTKCTCPGAPPRPSLVTLDKSIESEHKRSDSRLVSSSESPYRMWEDDDE